MSAYRIGGAIAALILLALLVILTAQWIGYSGMVQPTVNVSASPANRTTGEAAGESASRSAMAVLSARTRLQEDEVNKPPTAYPPLTGEEQLVFQPGVPIGEQLARNCHGDGRPDCPILEDLAHEA